MSDVEGQPEHIDQRDSRTLTPFLVAAGVVLLVLIGIVVSALVSPAEKNLTEDDRLAISARNFIQSRSGTDVLDPSTACSGFEENRSPLRPVEGEMGTKYDLVKVADPSIEGDRATAQVTYRADGKDATSTWTFTKKDNTWLVCNS